MSFLVLEYFLQQKIYIGVSIIFEARSPIGTNFCLFQKQTSKGVLENSFPGNFEKILTKKSSMKSFALKNNLITDIVFWESK